MKLLTTLFLLGFYTVFGQQWEAVGGGATNDVKDIYVDTLNNILYAVGEFQDIGNSGAYRVASWDGNSWTSLCNPPSNPSSDTNPIGSVVLYNGDLYVSGSHFLMGNVNTGRMARLNNGLWESSATIDGYALMKIVNNELFAICCFDSIDGQYIKNITRWNGVNWEPFGDTSVSNYIGINSLNDLTMYNGNYVFCGLFADPPYKHLMSWDGANWNSMGNGVEANFVNCVKEYQGILYIGGGFPTTNYNFSVAAWDGQNYFEPFSDLEFISQVFDLEVIDNELYIVGAFKIDTTSTTYGLAKFDGDTLSVFGGGYDILTPPIAQKIAGMNGDLFITTSVVYGTDSVNFIAKWTGNSIDTFFVNPIHLEVDELIAPDKKLIRIIDTLGRETEDKPNTVLIHIFSDGTIERVFRVE